MAVTCVEKQGSGALSSGASPHAELKYIIEGTADEQAALDKLEETAPATWKGLVADAAGVDPTEVATRWIGTVTYVEAPTGGTWSFRFDTGGGQQHITQSIATRNCYPVTARNFQGAIGVAGPDQVEGVDIGVPVFTFEVTYYIDDADMWPDDLRRYYELSNRTYNDDWFSVTINGKHLTFEAGEVRLLGVVGGIRQNEDQWEITCRFAASPNETGLTVGGIPDIVKLGWDYMWTHYKAVDQSEVLGPQARAVYVEQVYTPADYDDLRT